MMLSTQYHSFKGALRHLGHQVRESFNFTRIAHDLTQYMPRPRFCQADANNHIGTLHARLHAIPSPVNQAEISRNELKIHRALYRLRHLPDMAGLLAAKEGEETLDQETVYRATLGEVIAKKIAYRDIPEGFELQIASGAQGALEAYRVHRIHLYGTQYAYGLMPDNKQLAPILTFSGTVTDFSNHRTAGETFVADLCPHGPGHWLFLKGKRNLDRWLEEAYRYGNQKAWITGHSLGGAMATYAGIAFADRVETVNAYGSPGLHEHHYREWAALGEQQPDLIHWVDSEDFIPLMGPRLFGRCYATRRAAPRPPFFGMHDAHSKSTLLGGTSQLFRLDADRETQSRARRIAVRISMMIVSRFYFGAFRLLTHQQPF